MTDDANIPRVFYCPQCGATMRPRPRPRLDRGLELAYMVLIVAFFVVAIIATWFK